MFEGFKKFIARGNMIDMAVGVVMGGAVTTVVNAIVNSVINPFIAMIFGKPNMDGLLAITFNGADRKPHSVTPICTVDRNVFGSRAICATRLPRASSCSIWSICDPRRLTSASSVPANTEPSSRKMKIRRMFKPSDMIPI